MENVIDAFPFLRLPLSVQQRVLRTIRYMEQFTFSFISKKTKSIVKSLKTIAFARLSIKNPIKLEVCFNHFTVLYIKFGYGGGVELSVERRPCCWRLNYDGRERYVLPPAWRSTLTLRAWIFHLIDIYHNFEIIDLKFFDESLDFDIHSVRTALRGVDTPKLSIIEMANEDLFKTVTKLFLPTRRFEIDHHYRPQDTSHLRRVLLQNFEFFSAKVYRSAYFVSLDSLLSINASTVQLLGTTMSDKTVNQFLKLWTRGAMPRLKYLSIRFESDQAIRKQYNILKGVKYTELDEYHERSGMFENYYGPENETTCGGLIIKRYDGVEASIELNMDYNNTRLLLFQFYVWNH